MSWKCDFCIAENDFKINICAVCDHIWRCSICCNQSLITQKICTSCQRSKLSTVTDKKRSKHELENAKIKRSRTDFESLREAQIIEKIMGIQSDTFESQLRFLHQNVSNTANSSSWTCHVCTFINDDLTQLKCQECYTPKNATLSRSVHLIPSSKKSGSSSYTRSSIPNRRGSDRTEYEDAFNDEYSSEMKAEISLVEEIMSIQRKVFQSQLEELHRTIEQTKKVLSE